MGDTKSHPLCKKHHGHPKGGFWLFLTQQASSRPVKSTPWVIMQLLIDNEGGILYVAEFSHCVELLCLNTVKSYQATAMVASIVHG